MTRRFGMVSLTVYALHYFTIDALTAAINAMGGFQAPFCARGMWPKSGVNVTEDPGSCLATQQRGLPITNDGVSLIYIIVHIALWMLVLPLWQRVNFVGSIEWVFQAAVLSPVRGSKSDTLLKLSDVRFEAGTAEEPTQEVSCSDACGLCCGKRKAPHSRPQGTEATCDDRPMQSPVVAHEHA